METVTVPKDHVWTGAQIQELLDTQVKYKDWKFVVQEEKVAVEIDSYQPPYDEKIPVIRDIDLHLRAEWFAPDNVTGMSEKQSSRWWRLSKHMRKNEIINTAFACIKMAEEHEMRENFLYKLGENWTMPYNTHTDVDELAAASVVVDIRIDTRTEAPKNQRRD
jgi:hypothetical protein